MKGEFRERPDDDDYQCIHRLFEARVSGSPEHVAVICGEQSITYGELNERANWVARELIRAGAGPDRIVSIVTDRSIGTIAAILGTLKSGAAYLPLDPDYPVERLAFMVSDSGSSLSIVPAGFDKSLFDLPGEVLELTNETVGENPRTEVAGGNLAYAIYTSGSTGVPKAAANEHRGLTNMIRFTCSQLELGENDRVVQFASLSFDVSIWEIFTALVSGATLVLGDRDSLMPGPSLHRLIRHHRVTTAILSPTVLRVLPSEGLDCLRIVVSGVERITADIVKRWARGRRFFYSYGPTECAVTATFIELDEATDVAPSIGLPVPNTEIVILDEDLTPVAQGDAGELCIGGVGVGRGYLNREELTLERFVTLAPDGGPPRRFYRTGDRARERSNGELDFLGRMDFQVKIRGHRVELGEMEAVLEQHDEVASAVVLAGQDSHGQAELWAYHIRSKGSTYSGFDLENYLKCKLPAYMVPTTYIEVDRWPLTPNRKIDRTALPPPDRQGSLPQAESAEEMTATEAELARLCRELLGIESLGVSEDIFCAGFHSLLVAQLAWKIERRFAVEIRHSEIFESPTIGGLAKRVQAKERRAEDESVRIAAVELDGDPPLSFTQERVWFLESLNPEIQAYYFQVLLTLKGSLDVGALEKSLNEIVARHEILRTSFPVKDGRPVQRIHPYEPFELPIEQIGEPSTDERRSEARRRISRDALEPFHLDRLPLIRWKLYRVDRDEHLLLHQEHHLLHDGWSYGLFLGELFTLHHAYAAGKALKLPAPTIQYRDFSIWQRKFFEQGGYQSQLDYWVRKLREAPAPRELPIDRPRPPIQTFNGKQIRIDLDESFYSALTSVARDEGVTTYMWLFTLFQTLLHRYSGQTDLCVGSGFAGRGLPELEGLVGMVINTVAIRGDFSGGPTFREMLQRFRQTIIEASDNQDVPFDKVVQALNPERTGGQSVLFNTFFDAYSRPHPHVSGNGLTVTREDGFSNGNVKFDLIALVIPNDSAGQRGVDDESRSIEAATLIWEYNSDLFDDATGERLLRHFRNLLDSAMADPGCPISELAMLDDEEQRRLLVDWNDTASDYPLDASIPSLFEAEVERSPDAVAIVFDGQTVTYAELNRRANALAHQLRELGVGLEVRVGLCMERSVETMVSLLGILKAGGAYVPLDPSYPRARLGFMLEDTEAPVLLTQSKLLDELPEYSGRVLCVDELESGEFAETNPSAVVGGASLAYVMYTSGSTGKPKGVCIEHRSVVRLVKSPNYVTLGPSDVFLQLAPISFDASTFEVWGALLNGAKLVVHQPGLPSLEELGEALREHEVSVLWLTATLFHQMVDGQLENLRGVRQLLAGGETLSVSHVRRMLEALDDGHRLVNGYGPTENTTFTACHVMTRASQVEGSVPIGRPISSSQIYVLDAAMNPVPIGAAGELFIGGDGLAREYLNRPELTAEKFVANPFGGGRLYRTGDVVRYLADGCIEFRGRIDHQVKVRGFRIELGEVEAALTELESIEEAAVVLREDARGDKTLVACIRCSEPTAPRPETLRRELQELLPSHMVPSLFVVVDEFPLNPNGKLDREALTGIELPKARNGTGSVVPQSETERGIASIWRELLSLDTVGIHDNFFDLGGHSLLAMQVQTRIQAVFGVRVPIRGLFAAPTIGELARSVDALRGHGDVDVLVEREQGEL